jgi:hypothetical protein
MPTIAADYMVGALVNAGVKRVYGVKSLRPLPH